MPPYNAGTKRFRRKLGPTILSDIAGQCSRRLWYPQSYANIQGSWEVPRCSWPCGYCWGRIFHCGMLFPEVIKDKTNKRGEGVSRCGKQNICWRTLHISMVCGGTILSNGKSQHLSGYTNMHIQRRKWDKEGLKLKTEEDEVLTGDA
jgi:hypothetical protein